MQDHVEPGVEGYVVRVITTDVLADDVFYPVGVQKPGAKRVEPLFQRETRVEEVRVHGPEVVEPMSNGAVANRGNFLIIRYTLMIEVASEKRKKVVGVARGDHTIGNCWRCFERF